MDAISEPDFIVLKVGEYFFVRYGVHVAEDYKAFFSFKYPVEELTEQREWRIGDDDVRLITQFTDFFRAEIAIAMEIS